MIYTKISERDLLRIVWDAGIASGDLGEGRIIPLLILDATRRPDFVEFIRMHQYTPPGDIVVRWGLSPFNRKVVVLSITASRPIEIHFNVVFDAVKDMGLIDSAVHSNGVYLLAGKPGDRTATTIDEPRILFEVPDTGFAERWEKLLHKNLEKGFKKKGLGKKAAHEATLNHVKSMRQLWAFRMSGNA